MSNEINLFYKKSTKTHDKTIPKHTFVYILAFKKKFPGGDLTVKILHSYAKIANFSFPFTFFRIYQIVVTILENEAEIFKNFFWFTCPTLYIG